MLSKHQQAKKERQKLTGMMIKEVYEENFREEIEKLSSMLDKYRFVAMDTEFPGVIFPPTSNSKEQYYKSIKKNVDCLKLIQVGVTICDEEGNYPPEITTWQFNLKFDINTDQFSHESIALLTNSGINFDILAQNGIPLDIFGEYLITSGLLLNEDIHWVSFHGVYDFAYLMKVITGLPLPDSEFGFLESLKLYFPHYYDIRHIVRFSDNLRGSLSRLGQELNINRIGIQHQAGSDSIITSEIFFKLKADYFSEDLIRTDKNVLFGLGVGEDTEVYGYMFGGNLANLNNLNPVNSKLGQSGSNSNNNLAFPGNEGGQFNQSHNNFYSQNMMGLPYTYIQPRSHSALSSNTTPYFPHMNNLNNLNNLNNINPYHFNYPQNGLNYSPNYNIGMNNGMNTGMNTGMNNGMNLNINMMNMQNLNNNNNSEEKKKF